jgi:membrane protease YdiL (CAAX protease family)
MKTNIYIKLLLFLLSIVTAFHLSIIVKLIPYDITWGGRLKNDNEMYVFETISIFVNLFLISTLLIKGNYLKIRLNEKGINIVLWIFFFLFILNTIGNVVASTNFEKSFSVLTLILAILIWNILKKKYQRTAETSLPNGRFND